MVTRARTATTAVGIVPQSLIVTRPVSHPPPPLLPKRVPGAVLRAAQGHLPTPAHVDIRTTGQTSRWFIPIQAPQPRAGRHRADPSTTRTEKAEASCR